MKQGTNLFANIDSLGRIVIPKHLRKALDLHSGSTLELYLENKNIILKKHQETCVFCANIKNLNDFNGKCVCDCCIEELNAIK